MNYEGRKGTVNSGQDLCGFEFEPEGAACAAVGLDTDAAAHAFDRSVNDGKAHAGA
jgi:hypothetical protein